VNNKIKIRGMKNVIQK